jgi:hypothetical protein
MLKSRRDFNLVHAGAALRSKLTVLQSTITFPQLIFYAFLFVNENQRLITRDNPTEILPNDLTDGRR